MGEYLMGGESISEEQIAAWVTEADAGYDLEKLPRPRRGRPALSILPTSVVPVRLPADLLEALLARAEREGLSRAEAMREAVRAWAYVA